MPNSGHFKTHEDYLNYYRQYREKNRERLREYAREYNCQWREKNGYHNEHNWNKKNPEKIKAQRLLRYAVETKIIFRKPCVVCGNPKSQGHHADYSRPLEVEWLCAVHHAEKRKKLDQINRIKFDDLLPPQEAAVV